MIKINLIGDMQIGRSFNHTFKQNPNFNIWGNTLDILQKSNFVLGNLETTITDSNKKFPNKTFNFKLSPKYKNTLHKPNIKHVNIANNHILDYSLEGMLDTIKNLNELNIANTGAGLNPKEASKYVIHNVKGVRIGVISYADHYENWSARNNKPGINYIDLNDDNVDVLNYIKEIKKSVDILIFSIHHGSNYVDVIPENTVKFFHKLIEYGVDIIHGHSAHHVLPIEKIGDKYILYSMGDFIDDYAVDPIYRNDLSFIAELYILNGKLESLKIIPTKITIKYENDILMPQVNLIDIDDPDYSFVMDKLKWR